MSTWKLSDNKHKHIDMTVCYIDGVCIYGVGTIRHRLCSKPRWTSSSHYDNWYNPPTAVLNSELASAWSRMNKSYASAKKTQIQHKQYLPCYERKLEIGNLETRYLNLSVRQHSHLNGTNFRSDNFHQQDENFPQSMSIHIKAQVVSRAINHNQVYDNPVSWQTDILNPSWSERKARICLVSVITVLHFIVS